MGQCTICVDDLCLKPVKDTSEFDSFSFLGPLFPINLNGNHWTLLVRIKLTHNLTLDCLHLRSLRVNGVILIVIIIKCSSKSGPRNENESNSDVSFTGF